MDELRLLGFDMGGTSRANSCLTARPVNALLNMYAYTWTKLKYAQKGLYSNKIIRPPVI